MTEDVEHECDQEALVVVFDDGVPDHEVCPVCGKIWQ